MKEFTIDIKRAIYFELGPVAYILLQALNESRFDIIKMWYTHDSETIRLTLKTLENNLYIKICDYEELTGDVEVALDIRKKGEDLFKSGKNINFEDFFDIFPFKTTDGRVLKVKEKELNGKLTEGYKRARKLYLNKVTTEKEHLLAIEAVKARVESGDTKYMNNIGTYIRNKLWETDYFKYVKEDESDHWDKISANE